MLPTSATPGPTRLDRRVPGETDLRVFTSELLTGGRHRVDRTRLWLRVVREPGSGRPGPRVLLFARPRRSREQQ